MASIITGQGDPSVAASLYESAVLAEVAWLRRHERFVCLANVQDRLPQYNQAMLTQAFINLCLSGEIR